MQPRTEQVNFWRLSREGWCHRFLYQLHESHRSAKSQNNLTTRNYIRAQQHELDNELESARCSPATELDMLEERISKRHPPLQPPYTTTTSPNFDDGHTTETYHVGELQTLERLAPAINMLVICNLTGIPPRVGNVTFFGDAFRAALQWVRDDLPGLWSAFALRHGGIGIGSDIDPISNEKRDAIRRTTLESLPLEHISRVFVASRREIHRLVQIVGEQGVSRSDRSRALDFWSLRNLGDVLARFAICLDDDERESILSLAVKFTRVRFFREHPSFQETVFHLIERIVPYLSTVQMNEWLVDLVIEFPMSGRPDAEVDRWPLVTDFIFLPRDAKLSRPTSMAFESGVSSLIASVSQEHVRERTVAALRLTFLEKWELLSETEGRQFANALWTVTDTFGLPIIDDKYIQKFVHLSWPNVSGENIVHGLSKWIRAMEIRNRFSESTTSNGESRLSLSSADPDHFLHSILGISQHLKQDDELYSRIFDPSVKSHIWSSILKWWHRERNLFEPGVRAHRYFDIDPFDRIELILQVLLRCVLDRDTDEFDARVPMGTFLDEINKLRAVIPSSYPIHAFLERDSGNEYWDRLFVALWHGDRRVANGALVACCEWQRAAARLQLPEMPQDVSTGIIAKLADLNGEISYYAYAVVAALVAEGKFPREQAACNRLRDAADSAATKLAYGRECRSSLDGLGMDVEMYSHFRRRLAGLLFAMRDKEFPIGTVASKWLESAKRDKFVDVRHAAERGRWK